MSDLHQALAALAGLTHDELSDLLDLLTWEVKKRSDTKHPRQPARHGKAPLDKIIEGGWQIKPGQYTTPARTQLRNAYNEAHALDDSDLEALMGQAGLLRAALAPQPQRQKLDGQPVARGTLQTKIIRRWVIETDDDGNPHSVRKPFGPYLYLRIWTTGGGRNRDEKRLKNVYLGCKGLAARLDALDAGSSDRAALVTRILDTYYADDGGIEAVRDLDAGPVGVADILGDSDVLPNKESAKEKPPYTGDDLDAPAPAAHAAPQPAGLILENIHTLQPLDVRIGGKYHALTGLYSTGEKIVFTFDTRTDISVSEDTPVTIRTVADERGPVVTEAPVMRLLADHIKLMSKAHTSSSDTPAYVQRDSAAYGRLLELSEARYVDTFTQDTPRRVYFQLTDAGRAALDKHTRR